MAEESRVANQAQAQRWNGEFGEHWVRFQERHAAGHARLSRRLLEAAAIAPGDRVLDVGCGCGEITIAAARAATGPGAAGRGGALGLDVSATMLACAERLAAADGVAGIEFACGDAQVYPLPPGGFDVAVSSFGVMFFASPQAAFANIAGALHDGGRLAFLCWQGDADNDQFAIPARALAAAKGEPAPASDDLFADPGWITGLLTGAGFSGIAVQPVHDEMWLGASTGEVMDYVGSIPRVRSQLASLGAQGGRQALAAMAAEFGARRRPDGVWAACAAWLVTARRPGAHRGAAG